MIITKRKKQSGKEFVMEMEEKYSSIDELEELFNDTNNMKMYVDLRNWRYYKNHLDEEIESVETRILNNH